MVYVEDVEYTDKHSGLLAGKCRLQLTILTGYARWRFGIVTSCVEMLLRKS